MSQIYPGNLGYDISSTGYIISFQFELYLLQTIRIIGNSHARLVVVIASFMASSTRSIPFRVLFHDYTDNNTRKGAAKKKKTKKKDELFADYQKRYTFAADITTNEMRTIMVNTYWWRFLQLTKS